MKPRAKRYFVVVWTSQGVVMALSAKRGLANPSEGAGQLFLTRGAAQSAIEKAIRAWGDAPHTYRVVPVSRRTRQP